MAYPKSISVLFILSLLLIAVPAVGHMEEEICGAVSTSSNDEPGTASCATSRLRDFTDRLYEQGCQSGLEPICVEAVMLKHAVEVCLQTAQSALPGIDAVAVERCKATVEDLLSIIETREDPRVFDEELDRILIQLWPYVDHVMGLIFFGDETVQGAQGPALDLYDSAISITPDMGDEFDLPSPKSLLGQGAWYVNVPKESLGMQLTPVREDTLGITDVGAIGLAIASDPTIEQTSNVHVQAFSDGIIVDDPPATTGDKWFWGGVCVVAVVTTVVAAPDAPPIAVAAAVVAAYSCSRFFSAMADEGQFVRSGQHSVKWGGPGGNSATKNEDLSIIDATLAISESSDHNGQLTIPYPWAAGGTYEEGKRACEQKWAAAKAAAEADAATWQETAGSGQGSIDVTLGTFSFSNADDLGRQGWGIAATLRDSANKSGGHILGPMQQPTDEGIIDIDEIMDTPALLVWDCGGGCPLALRLSISSCGDGTTQPEEGGVEYEFIGSPQCFTIAVYINGQSVVPPTNAPVVLRGEFEAEGNGATQVASEP